MRELFEELWGTTILSRAGPAHPEHVRRRDRRHVPRRCSSRARTSRSPTRTPSTCTRRSRSLDLLVVQDLFLNETAKFAHVLLPGTSFLEKDGTFTNAERRINRVRPVMAPQTGKHEWEIVCEIAQAMGYPMHYDNAAQIMDEIAQTTPTFAGRLVRPARRGRQRAVAVQRRQPRPARRSCTWTTFVRGKGHFVETPYVPTDERSTRQVPADPHDRPDPVAVQRRRADASHRRTSTWHPEDILEIHPHDAEVRGINDGDWVTLTQPGRRDHAAREDHRPDAAWASSTRPSTTRSPAPTS